MGNREGGDSRSFPDQVSLRPPESLGWRAILAFSIVVLASAPVLPVGRVGLASTSQTGTDATQSSGLNFTAHAPPPVRPQSVLSAGLFAIYQRGPAVVRGVRCPMSPSCSEYGNQACTRFGIVRGALMSADRILRCGHDLWNYPIAGDGRAIDRVPGPANSEREPN